MDRLISEKSVMEVIYECNWFINEEHAEVIKERIKAIPSAEPYKGMTNVQVHNMLYQMLVKLKNGADRYGAEDWWNSPYSERSDKE